MKRVILLTAVLALSAGLLVPGVSAQSQLTVPPEVADQVAAAKGASAVYIVQMAEDPVVAYDGGVAGLARTARSLGNRINPNSAAARAYTGFLNERHDRALAGVGGGSKIYDYTFSFNGFAARITPAQAAELAARPDVVNVWADELRQPTTENSPSFLGLTDDPGGLHTDGILGEDVIIGVIDTGIWPEHPSFSDQIDLADRPGNTGKNTRAYDAPPSDWFGTCPGGVAWNRRDCNFKLIGARYFHDGFSNFEILMSGDYLSPRDADGHGSHTASTAGGNADVPATVFGVDRGLISGIAPRARIAAYKACWADAGCAGSDLVAAIDTAVADGVDVINYSIGGGATTVLTADAIAFLFAADAGVYVANSAGNSGPGASTLGNPAVAPWLTSVGASTQDRNFIGSVELSAGPPFFGGSITGDSAELPLVDAEDAAIGADPEDVEDAELCLVGSLDPAVVSGNIVLCLRGENARVDKSLAVLEAGGEGMVLYNATPTQSINTDNHWVPTVHVNFTDGSAIKTAIETNPGLTAEITGGVSTPDPAAPSMADFSSRGPNPGSTDVIKPDITAPGVSVLAANSPTPFLGAPGELFQSIAGTSMSSPHVAGVFALLKEAHGDWSAAVAKSAIMTTADQDVEKEDGVTQADPFDMGGGHLNPNSAVDPGLAYDAGFFEYLGFLCDAAPQAFVNPAATCAALEADGIPTDASDLNLASIAVGELAGFQTVTRTVTNVDDATATYEVLVNAPSGIDVVVAPDELTLEPGETAVYEVTFTTAGATFDVFAFGSLTWSDGTHEVRSPIAVRPVQIAAPAEVQGAGTSGTLDFDVTFGYTGVYSAEAHGLVPAELQPDVVVDDPTNDINTALSTGVGVNFHEVVVPSGALHARFSLFDDYTDGADDLDLFVFGPAPDFEFVGQSTGVTSEEQVDVPDPNPTPDPVTYTVVVHAFQTDGPDAAYTLFSWSFSADAGNLTFSTPPTPTSATLGVTETIRINWTGLDPLTKSLGAVSHNDAGGRIGVTIVRIDTDGP